MREQSHLHRSGGSDGAIRLVALAAVTFYMSTAHLTRGHEADFGKQWLAARLVTIGQGRHMFDVEIQRLELGEHFTAEVIERGIWRAGIGGPTYPPTLGVVLAPLGWLSPRQAQWIWIELSVLLVLLAARQVSQAVQGQLTWEAAALATLCLPSFFLAVGVGQNSALSLAIFAGGWSLLVRERAFMAGAVWGLFALKPTWGIAVAWLPAVVGRPRAYRGMAVTVAMLFALSLPFCGIEAWRDWLGVARQTEHLYETLPRWTALSRDLPGLVRRVGQGSAIEFAGWAALVLVLGVTAWTWRASRTTSGLAATGPRAAALLAGSLLTCPRFMFYDMTLAIVPILVGFAGWALVRPGSRWAFAGIVGVLYGGTALSYARWQMLGPPIDTFALVGLWIWAVVETHRMHTPPETTPVPAPDAAKTELVAELV